MLLARHTKARKDNVSASIRSHLASLHSVSVLADRYRNSEARSDLGRTLGVKKSSFFRLLDWPRRTIRDRPRSRSHLRTVDDMDPRTITPVVSCGE